MAKAPSRLSGIYALPKACTIIDRLDISEIEAGYKGGGTSSYNLRKYIALGCARAQRSGRQLPLRGVSTPGHGQGEGPVGSKLSRSDDTDDDGRGRSERSERSPLRGKLPPLRSLAHQKEEADHQSTSFGSSMPREELRYYLRGLYCRLSDNEGECP